MVTSGLDEFMLDISVRKWESGPAEQVVNKDRYYGVLDRQTDQNTDNMKIIWTPQSRAEGALLFFDEVLNFSPKAYQEEILFLLYQNRRSCVRAPRGAGKCIPANEMMQLSGGELVKASTLIGKTFRVKTAEKSRVVRTAVAIGSDNGIQEVLEIVTDMGRVIRRTRNHPLWADLNPVKWDNSRWQMAIVPNGSWEDAENLSEGSLVAVYAGNPVDRPSSISDTEIKLTAYLVGDGGLTSGGVRFSQEEGAVLDEFRMCCNEVGCDLSLNTKMGYSVRKSPKHCSDDAVGRILSKKKSKTLIERMLVRDGLMGCDSFEKSLPEWVWLLDDRQIGVFLSRLYACDGWAYSGEEKSGKKRREIGYCSVSKILAYGVQRLLLRLGIQASVRSKKTSWPSNGEKKTGNAYCVDIRSRASATAFCERVGIYGKEAQISGVMDSFSKSIDSSQKWRSRGIRPDMRWEKVSSIKSLGMMDTVCVSVPSTETFLTDFHEHNSAIMAAIIIHFMVMNDPCKVPTTASSWAQLEEFLWPEIHVWCNGADWGLIGEKPKLNTMDMRIGGDDFEKSTQKAFAIRSDEPAKLEGAHSKHALIVVDEAKAVEDAMFDAVEGTLSKGDKFILVGSTPGAPRGRFWMIQTFHPGYEDWAKGVKRITFEELRDQITDEQEREDYIKWADQKKLQWGEDSELYQNQVLGNFADVGEDNLIPLSWVEAANARWREWAKTGFSQKYPGVDGGSRKLGIDAAGSGKDKTAIAKRMGTGIREVLYRGKSNSIVISDEVMGLLLSEGYETALIEVDGGYGSGAYDQGMKTLYEDQVKGPSDRRFRGKRVKAVVSGSKAASGVHPFTDTTGMLTFRNMRSWMWYKMKELLDPVNGKDIMLPPDELLTGDLTVVKFKIVNQVFSVESKDEIRKRLKRSTDSGDAVIFAFSDDTVSVVTQHTSVSATVRVGPRDVSIYDAMPDWRITVPTGGMN